MICYGHVLDDDTTPIETTGLPVHKRVVCVNYTPTTVACLTPAATCGAPDDLVRIQKNRSDKATLLDLLQQLRVMLRSILKSSDHTPLLTADSSVSVDANLLRLYKQKAYALMVATDLLQPITDAINKDLVEEVETLAKSIITFGASETLPFVALAELNRQIAERQRFLYERDEVDLYC